MFGDILNLDVSKTCLDTDIPSKFADIPLSLKGHWQISKNRCSEKYCSYDGACHFSAL